MKRPVLVSCVCTLMLLAGCVPNKAAVDPYAYAPKTPATTWKPAVAIPDPPAVPVDDTPLSLAEILDISLQNNPSTKMTWAKARAAAAQYGSAQSGDMPTLDANYSYIRSRSSTVGAGPSGGTGGVTTPGTSSVNPNAPKLVNYFLSQWGPQFILSYTLLDFGQTRATAEAAKQALYTAGYTHNRQLQTVVQQVTSDYYTYLYQKQLLDANEADVKTAEITFDAAKVGLDAGVKAVSDVLQAQTQLLQAKIQLITQHQNVVNALAQLLADMGLKANQPIQLQGVPDVPPVQEMLKSADELLTVALQSRADLLAAEASVKSQEAHVQLARRQFFPTVTYGMNFGETSYTKLGSDGYDFTGTLSLNFPLFSGFTTLNSLKQAKAQKEQAEANLRQLQLDVIQQITVAHSTTKSSFDTLKQTDTYLETAKEQYEVALARYKAGTGTILEVTTAQSTLADARAKQTQATNQWFTSLVQLSYAAGTLEIGEAP